MQNQIIPPYLFLNCFIPKTVHAVAKEAGAWYRLQINSLRVATNTLFKIIDRTMVFRLSTDCSYSYKCKTKADALSNLLNGKELVKYAIQCTHIYFRL